MNQLSLLPTESEHDVRVLFLFDPASVGMTTGAIFLLMVLYLKVLKR